jgi:hypothetical protein
VPRAASAAHRCCAAYPLILPSVSMTFLFYLDCGRECAKRPKAQATVHLHAPKVFFMRSEQMPVRQRQVIAYQQFFRRVEEIKARPKKTEQSPEVKRLFNELFQQARPRGLEKKFQYEAAPELIEALRPEYQERLDTNFRHPDSFQLNSYSLAEFKPVYVALLILCAIHEHICYPWEHPGHAIPTSSLVLVKQRSCWVRELSAISHTPLATCAAIIEDLTLKPESASFTSLCITPFVPLDRKGNTLAVAPQFPLASAVDENILRQFSYLYRHSSPHRIP